MTIALFLLFIPPAFAQSTEAWYAFTLDKNLDPDSPANIGRHVLNAPAGIHGYVEVNGADFQFDNGSPARFWGTNLCRSGAFPPEEEAKFAADRIAFFGFNAVRFSDIDSAFAPDGLLEDSAPGYTDPQLKNTQLISREQLDRMDRLIYLLKRRGIYTAFNLLTNRRFTVADGVVQAGLLGPGAKPACLFDPHLIKLQQIYAKQLLTHYNPYTESRYSEEPAVAFVEIVNDCSLIRAWQQGRLNEPDNLWEKAYLPEFYLKQLDDRWNRWLEKKYPTPAEAIAIWGLDGLEPVERAIVQQDHLWVVEKHADARCRFNSAAGAAILHADLVTGKAEHLQYRRNRIPTVAGQNYLLEFTGSADRTLNIQAVIQQATFPLTHLGLDQSCELDRAWRIYQIPFTATDDCLNAKLTFYFGAQKAMVRIKDVRLSKVTTLPILMKEAQRTRFDFKRPKYAWLYFYPELMQKDIREFYLELERAYFTEMERFLRVEAGVQVPVTGISGYPLPENLRTQEDLDYVDAQAFWDYPQFPDKAWDRSDFRIHNESIFGKEGEAEETGLLAGLIEKEVRDKPFTVSEWNHCYPNTFSWETPVLLAHTARERGWDAVFQYNFANSADSYEYASAVNDYFEIAANPQQLLLCSLGSLVYLGKEELKKTVSETGIGLSNSSAAIIYGAPALNPSPKRRTLFHTRSQGVGALIAPDGVPLDEAQELILYAVGPLQARGSKRRSDKHFLWGDGTPMLCGMDLQLFIHDRYSLQVYALDEKGEPHEEPSLASGRVRHDLNLSGTQSPWYLLKFE
ncbi:MAG: hypothetical protein JW937_03495 [Candidatus Omnitrophica bacterium]|nr:hypothetical protein [Candidatus Omnitrophota bacterium]